MSPRVVVFAALFTVATAYQARGQQRAQDKEQSIHLTAGSPGEAGVAHAGLEAILEGSSDDSKATARVGFKVADNWALDTTISSPLDKSLSRTAVLSDSGHPLANDARFTVGGSRTFLRFKAQQASVNAVCAKVVGPCNTTNPNMTEDQRTEMRKAIKTAYIAGGRFSVGRAAFSYRLAEDGKTIEESQTTPVAASFGLGALFRNNWFVLVQGGAEHVWQQPNKPKTYCLLVGPTSTALSCEDVSIGAPAETTGATVVLEARRFFSKWAVAPRIEYRETKSLKLFEVPIYFLSDPERGGWTGGALFRVKNGDATLAVFVGAALPYFGLK